MTFLETIQQQLIAPLDRRREPRTFADQEVILRSVADEDRTGAATVLDWSVNGMRVSHSLSLKSGQCVRVIGPDWILTMRVVWVGYINGVLEAGLVIELGRQSDSEHVRVVPN